MFAVVVGIQIPSIVKTKHRNLRAIEAVAVTGPLFVLIFSRIYPSNFLANPAAFTQPLDTTTAVTAQHHGPLVVGQGRPFLLGLRGAPDRVAQTITGGLRSLAGSAPAPSKQVGTVALASLRSSRLATRKSRRRRTPIRSGADHANADGAHRPGRVGDTK